MGKQSCERSPLTVNSHFPAQHTPPAPRASLHPQLYPCDTTGQRGRRGETESTSPVARINYMPGYSTGVADEPFLQSHRQIISGTVAMILLFDHAASSEPGLETTTNYPQTVPSSCPPSSENDYRRRERQGLNLVRSLATVVTSTPLTPHSEETADCRCHQGAPRHR